MGSEGVNELITYVGYAVLDGLKYASSHEWVKHEGPVATIGITDHAQVWPKTKKEKVMLRLFFIPIPYWIWPLSSVTSVIIIVNEQQLLHACSY